MPTIHPGAAVWSAALLTFLVLLGLLYLAVKISTLEPRGSLRWVLTGLFVAALLSSGFAVSVLANWTTPPDVRLTPGIPARWSPALLAALAALAGRRGRRPFV